MDFVLQITILIVNKSQILLKIHLIVKAGFVVNEEKSSWAPVQSLDWLGFKWNLVRVTLELQESKIEDLITSIIILRILIFSYLQDC